MSGYRESGFDPNGSVQQGRPLRPFNWVQWTGVALIVLGAVTALVYLAGEIGLVRHVFGKSLPPFYSFPVIGMLLVNSRREGGTDAPPVSAIARRRWLIITIAVCACIFSAAVVIALKGV